MSGASACWSRGSEGAWRRAGRGDASAPLTARCAQVNGRPPLCHVILNVIVAFWFPIVSHFLARPDDHISLS
eukprot:COSAG04_NODE_17689_length_462_cov_0.542700_1_plen_71_part_10